MYNVAISWSEILPVLLGIAWPWIPEFIYTMHPVKKSPIQKSLTIHSCNCNCATFLKSLRELLPASVLSLIEAQNCICNEDYIGGAMTIVTIIPYIIPKSFAASTEFEKDRFYTHPDNKSFRKSLPENGFVQLWRELLSPEFSGQKKIFSRNYVLKTYFWNISLF